MTGRFEGRVCLITGSTGIAAATALALGAEGGRLVIASRTPDHVESLASEIVEAGGEAIPIAIDLVESGAADRLVATTVEAFGRLDCVYNVAGISGRRFGDGPADECTDEGWDKVVDTNARTMFFVCRASIRQMLSQGEEEAGSRGAILNMSSVLARSPSSHYFATHAYAASKGAIEAFSRAMAAYYAARGIRVNVIAPSLVATPMSLRAQGDQRIVAYLAAKQPLADGPLVPDDVVGTALFLLSTESAMVTGQVVGVDGGWSVTEAR